MPDKCSSAAGRGLVLTSDGIKSFVTFLGLLIDTCYAGQVDTKRLRAFQNAVDSLFSQQKVAAPIKDYNRNAKISRHHLAPAIPRILHQVYLGGEA